MFYVLFCILPKQQHIECPNVIKSSPQLTLTTEMTMMEEKLTSQVAMDTDVAE